MGSNRANIINKYTCKFVKCKVKECDHKKDKKACEHYPSTDTQSKI